MSSGSKGAKKSQGRAPGGGGYAKSGKPRPGTGGYGKHKLEGKGPTPPAELRPGHPAQKAAAARAKAAAAGRTARPRPTSAPAQEPAAERRDDGPEMVAGRNPVVESLRARVPAMALYVTGRAQEDERVAESVQLAASAA